MSDTNGKGKAYQFDLTGRRLTKGTQVYGNAEELLCNTLYLSKGAVNLMKEVFPEGMPPGIRVTIQPLYGEELAKQASANIAEAAQRKAEKAA